LENKVTGRSSAASVDSQLVGKTTCSFEHIFVIKAWLVLDSFLADVNGRDGQPDS